MSRLTVAKTHKLYIGGAFVRSESGRSEVIRDADWAARAHLCRASRKDLRDAVRAASKAQPGWADRDAYNRGQILYRLAEMLEGRRAEFTEELHITGAAASSNEAGVEFDASVDRLVAFAGWADKFHHVLGCQNPVAGPYQNFTTPEPTGVTAIVVPDRPGLLGLVSLAAPLLCAGNTLVAVSGRTAPIVACLFAELSHTSDVPPGVLNVLTGDRAELIPHIAGHREINGVHAADLPDEAARMLRAGAAENLKRVKVRTIGLEPGDAEAREGWYDDEMMESPWIMEPFLDMKTTWRPAAT